MNYITASSVNGRTWTPVSGIKARLGTFREQGKTSAFFMAVYRAFGLVVGCILLLLEASYLPITAVGWVVIGVISLFACYKIGHTMGFIKSRLAPRLDFGIDLLTCLTVPFVTGGFSSPFLVYMFCPVLTAALFYRLGAAFAVAPLPFLAAAAGHFWLHQSAGIEAFTQASLSPFILISYPVMSVALAMMPYLANVNTYRRVKARAIAEERGRLSRDMHDGLSQSLGTIRWRCELLRKNMTFGSRKKETLEHLDFIIEELTEAQREARDIVDQLFKTSQVPHSLVSRLAQEATDYTRQYGIQCHLHVADGRIKLSEMAEMQLLCVAQESLANIRKHADASSIEVSLVSQGGRTVMTISDDGHGFDPNSVHGGHGLQVMEDRVKSIGGHIYINTGLQRGTVVTVELEGPGTNLEETQ
jgi:signal transduction histidine kinase